MPGLDGFGVVREIGSEQMPAVIFVTAYDEHAVKAFEVHALDYLLKPFRPDRFTEAVDRVVQIIREGERGLSSDLEAVVAGQPRYIDRILVKGARKAVFVRAKDINWIEAAGNYLRLHVGDKTHLIRQTMNNLQHQLDPDQFVRIHRSAIVNLTFVRELRRDDAGEYVVVLDCGNCLRLSRGYRRGLDRFDPLALDFAR
jgi:two-component system LytT family response regulator